MGETLLRDQLDPDFLSSNSPAKRFADIKTLLHVDGCEPGQGWPGTHKNVMSWYVLENGYFVGFNENPGRGWSYPLYKPTEDEFKKAQTFKEFGWDF